MRRSSGISTNAWRANRFGSLLAALCIDRVPLGNALHAARVTGFDNAAAEGAAEPPTAAPRHPHPARVADRPCSRVPTAAA